MSETGAALPRDWTGAPVTPLRWMARAGATDLVHAMFAAFDAADRSGDWGEWEEYEGRLAALLAWAERRWGGAWDHFWEAECVPPGIDIARRLERQLAAGQAAMERGA